MSSNVYGSAKLGTLILVRQPIYVEGKSRRTATQSVFLLRWSIPVLPSLVVPLALRFIFEFPGCVSMVWGVGGEEGKVLKVSYFVPGEESAGCHVRRSPLLSPPDLLRWSFSVRCLSSFRGTRNVEQRLLATLRFSGLLV